METDDRQPETTNSSVGRWFITNETVFTSYGVFFSIPFALEDTSELSIGKEKLKLFENTKGDGCWFSLYFCKLEISSFKTQNVILSH